MKDGALNRMMGRSGAEFIKLRIKDSEMQEVEGKACLRIEYSNE